MNTQNNIVSIHSLSTGDEMDTTLISSSVSRDRENNWVGKSVWSFAEKPALPGDEALPWQIQLYTSKGSRGISSFWQVHQRTEMGIRFTMFQDYRLQGGISPARASEKAVAAAHEIEAARIDEVKALAIKFYQDKLTEEG